MRLVNIGAKVADVTAAAGRLGALRGVGEVRADAIDGEPFADVALGDLRLSLFSSVLHDASRPEPAPMGLVHVVFAVDDLAAMLDDPGWAACLLHGPQEISGGFGRRRIAFFEPQPGLCIELMEELHDV